MIAWSNTFTKFKFLFTKLTIPQFQNFKDREADISYPLHIRMKIMIFCEYSVRFALGGTSAASKGFFLLGAFCLGDKWTQYFLLRSEAFEASARHIQQPPST